MKILGLVLACGMLGASVNAMDPQANMTEKQQLREFVETADRLIADIEARKASTDERVAQFADRIISAIRNIKKAGLNLESYGSLFYGPYKYKTVISALHSFFLKMEERSRIHAEEPSEIKQLREATIAAIRDIDAIAQDFDGYEFASDSIGTSPMYPITLSFGSFSGMKDVLYKEYENERKQYAAGHSEGH